MVRPGPFLSANMMKPRLVLSALAAAVGFAVVCAPLHAETAVGLEAQGVDPLVALRNHGDLDLRDELGRPVSPQLIARQLKAAQAEAAADNAFSSRLPQARAVTRMLELWEGIKSHFGRPGQRMPWHSLWALPSPRGGGKAAAASASFLPAFSLLCALTVIRRSFLPRVFSGAPLSLRC